MIQKSSSTYPIQKYCKSYSFPRSISAWDMWWGGYPWISFWPDEAGAEERGGWIFSSSWVTGTIDSLDSWTTHIWDWTSPEKSTKPRTKRALSSRGWDSATSSIFSHRWGSGRVGTRLGTVHKLVISSEIHLFLWWIGEGSSIQGTELEDFSPKFLQNFCSKSLSL